MVDILQVFSIQIYLRSVIPFSVVIWVSNLKKNTLVVMPEQRVLSMMHLPSVLSMISCSQLRVSHPTLICYVYHCVPIALCVYVWTYV